MDIISHRWCFSIYLYLCYIGASKEEAWPTTHQSREGSGLNILLGQPLVVYCRNSEISIVHCPFVLHVQLLLAIVRLCVLVYKLYLLTYYLLIRLTIYYFAFSALMLLVGSRKGIRPVKTEYWVLLGAGMAAWLSVWNEV